jgi:hypothetical protein
VQYLSPNQIGRDNSIGQFLLLLAASFCHHLTISGGIQEVPRSSRGAFQYLVLNATSAVLYAEKPLSWLATGGPTISQQPQLCNKFRARPARHLSNYFFFLIIFSESMKNEKLFFPSYQWYKLERQPIHRLNATSTQLKMGE